MNRRRLKRAFSETGAADPALNFGGMGRKYHRAKREEAMSDKQYTAEEVRAAFLAGVEWADENDIEKSTEHPTTVAFLRYPDKEDKR
jgi:hypothetical protein